MFNLVNLEIFCKRGATYDISIMYVITLTMIACQCQTSIQPGKSLQNYSGT